MKKMIIQCKELNKYYGKTHALKNVNLNIEQGRIIGLLGPNGSGKTTLIKILNNLLEQNDGLIEINGAKPGVESKKAIAYLPDCNYLNLNATPNDLINFFSEFYDNFNVDKANQLLAKLNLNPHAKLKTMSKGTIEKVQLSLVMARDAQVYILDEPIAGVDPASRDFILDTILSNLQAGKTLIISTHLINDIENILDEVIFIQNGNILLHENCDSLREKHGMSIDRIFREEFRCY